MQEHWGQEQQEIEMDGIFPEGYMNTALINLISNLQIT